MVVRGSFWRGKRLGVDDADGIQVGVRSLEAGEHRVHVRVTTQRHRVKVLEWHKHAAAWEAGSPDNLVPPRPPHGLRRMTAQPRFPDGTCSKMTWQLGTQRIEVFVFGVEVQPVGRRPDPALEVQRCRPPPAVRQVQAQVRQ